MTARNAMAEATAARNLQERSMDTWERQKHDWNNLASVLAAKAGKREEDCLHNTIHHYRERLEELDYIQASIPQAARATETGWEMSLRNEGNKGDGIRYVRFGSDYPYPLYCPIKSRDNVGPDDNAFLRLVPFNAPTSSKRKGLKDTSSYYRQRGEQYKKHIQKKFAHITHAEEREPFLVEGQRPAYTAERVEEDVTAPIQHYQCVYEGEEPAAIEAASAQETPAAEAGAEAGGGEVQQEAAAAAAAAAEEPEKLEGPLLLLASSRVQFATVPHELAHATLKATNLGTTAIYYSWRQLPNEPITSSSGRVLAPSSEGAAMFTMSEAHSGVFLPGEEHNFAFSFRATMPCIASESWELQTVPSGKGRFTLHLRGVTASTERDPVSTAFLSRTLQAKIDREVAKREAAASAAAQDGAGAGGAGRCGADGSAAAESAEEPAACERASRIAALEAQWEALNGVPCAAGACRSFLLLHESIEAALAAGRSADEPARQKPAWNGDVLELVADAHGISDAGLRAEYLAALSDLRQASRHVHEPGSTVPLLEEQRAARLAADAAASPPPDEAPAVSLHYAVCRTMLENLAEDLVDSSYTIQEKLGLLDPALRTAAPAGKGGKAAAAKGGGKKAAGKGKDDTERSQEELQAAYKKQLHACVAARLSDTVWQAVAAYEATGAQLGQMLHHPEEFCRARLKSAAEEAEGGAEPPAMEASRSEEEEDAPSQESPAAAS